MININHSSDCSFETGVVEIGFFSFVNTLQKFTRICTGLIKEEKLSLQGLPATNIVYSWNMEIPVRVAGYPYYMNWELRSKCSQEKKFAVS